MRTIDFLSIAPQTFIFQKSSNKTTFGGFLTLIYGLIVLLMAVVYYYNYSINDKYIISYSRYQKVDWNDYAEKEKDPNYNPTLTFLFDVEDFHRQPLSKNFLLLDYNNKTLIERNTYYKYNVSKMTIVVIYNCSDQNCYIREEDYSMYYNFNPVLYFTYERSYFEYDLQDDDEPAKLSKDLSGFRVGFNPEIGQSNDHFWQVTKIVEEKGMFDKLMGNKKESFGGNYYQSEISTIKTTIVPGSQLQDYNDERLKSGFFKILYIFNSLNQLDDYIEYKRKKVSEFDLVANICSLALTIFNAFKLGFSILYSSNFDNYKIIDRILSTRDISMEKISKKTEDTKSPLLTELKEIDEENANEYENEKKDKLIEAKKVEENKQSILPKYHFFDFICNIFSCCFKNNNAQKCISACNEIKQKYYSIENILYNQFMMENLLKDYKWNNPDLKFIKNIQLIDKLNYIINDNQT